MAYRWDRLSILNASGQKLAALFCRAAVEEAPVIIVCHGFTGSKEGGGRALSMAEALALRGWHTLLFDFSGAGESEGSAEEITLSRQISDLGAVVEWCRRQGLGPLLLTGRSFGGTTALCYAAEDSGIAAVCTWAAVARPADLFCRFVREWPAPGQSRVALTGEEGTLYISREFFRDLERHDPLRAAAAIAPRPLLVIHGTADQVVPCSQAELIYRAAGAPKSIERIPGADHRFSNHQEAVWRTFFAWLDRVRQEG